MSGRHLKQQKQTLTKRGEMMKNANKEKQKSIWWLSLPLFIVSVLIVSFLIYFSWGLRVNVLGFVFYPSRDIVTIILAIVLTEKVESFINWINKEN